MQLHGLIQLRFYVDGQQKAMPAMFDSIYMMRIHPRSNKTIGILDRAIQFQLVFSEFKLSHQPMGEAIHECKCANSKYPTPSTHLHSVVIIVY